MLLVLNMMDAAREEGIRIDESELSRSLGVPVIGISAAKGEGLGHLRRLMEREVEPSTLRFRQWPPHLLRVLQRLDERLPRHPLMPERARDDFALAILLDDGEDDALARHAPPDVLEDARILAGRLDLVSPGWRGDDVEEIGRAHV